VPSPSVAQRPAWGRFTRGAVALLTLDGVALVVGGVLARHVPLVLAGVTLCGGALFVVWYARWHERQLAEIAAARAALRDEARGMRELVREG
jgi:hypothetical protein